ncbi:MAG: PAS domain-containing protein [Candidatus Eisenbacteria bacterium]|uniref:histidine kinase n=1 Tax=Eiseniibacteriota bacterium TaxID=2212470 RepID=A0A7Y2E5Q9_UNCEI|nr:PAS domain-containing protein [Candidatus Eisenbacteria bacterium]
MTRIIEEIVSGFPGPVILLDSNHKILRANASAELLFDAGPGQLTDQLTTELFVSNESNDVLADLLQDNKLDIGLTLPSGNRAVVSMNAQALPEDKIAIFLTDHTELYSLRSQAQNKNKFAELGELSAGIAHEIRNPLAGIGASAQVLRGRLQGEHEELLGVILHESARLERLVSSLLKYARPPRPKMQKTLIHEPVERALGLIDQRAEKQGVALSTKREGELPGIWIDPDLMEQVFLNLMQNALEAMPSGGNLAINTRTVSRPAYVRKTPGRRREDASLPKPTQPQALNWVEVEIADSGPGIAEDIQDRIFRPFFTTRSEGTGLGLPICRSIVQQHAGQLLLENLDPGTVFRVALPIEKRSGQRRRQ